jgi:NDP-sugar pyrophosphorylase family protein
MRPVAATLGAIDAVILCGGKGTRLQSVVANQPKGLAAVNGRPLLDILVDDVIHQGVRRIILCVGHLSEQIIEHFSGRADAEFLFSAETTPLGTGGAIKHAAGKIRSDPFLAMNGDSICRVELREFLAFHNSHAADATIVVAPDTERRDAGTIGMGADGRIASFDEKLAAADAGTGLINAGIYLFKRELPEAWDRDYPFSLEYDVFPQIAAGARCFGFRTANKVVDIGTPERYRRAQDDLAK